jgi:outer membrane receptor protein involved in Fe transport
MNSGENQMQSNLRLNKLQLVVLLAVLFAAAFGMAQGITTGSISGTVLDPSSAVVVGATVTAQNTATGGTLTTLTNDTGYFTFRSVPPGTYRVTIAGTGFRTVEVQQVTVETSKDATLAAIKMQLTSAAGVTVEVVEAAPILETTTGQVTNTFDTKETADLPTGGGFDSLALFLPGVADTGSNNFSNTNGVGFSSNGLRGRSNNFQIDGQGNNDNSVAGPSIFLGNQDLLSEVSVITNDFSVEYGRASGSVVNYVTKSGTNQIHGSAFEYWTGSRWDSLGNGESRISRYVENRPGFTVGGPIHKDKAFFFGSAYWDRVRQAGATVNSGGLLTPTPLGLTELATAFPGNLAVAALNAIGPYSVKAGNPRVCLTDCNGATTTILNVSDINQDCTAPLNTCVPIEFGQIERNPPSIFNDREFSGKVDVNVTTKDRLSARYVFQQNILTAATAAGPGNSGFAAGAWVDIPARDQQIALDWTRSVSSQLVNQLRYSFSRASVPFEGGSFPGCTRSAILSCPTNISISSAQLLTFGMATNLPQGRTINNTQVQDNLSWARGHHTFKIGGEFLKQRSPNVFLPNINGAYNFQQTGTPDGDFSAFLQDNPLQISLTDGPKNFNFKEWDIALYAGDDWRIKDNLTLNLGLRWDYSSQAINLLHDLSVATQHGPSPFWDPTLPDSITTVPSVPNHFKYFGPNIGFAWKPRFFGAGDKTVIRGGFRITYDPAYYNMFLNVATAAPDVNAGTILGTTCTGPCLPTTGFSGAAVQAAHLVDIPRGGNPGKRSYTQVARNFHNPYVQNWSLGIQRELTSRVVVEARYVGNRENGNFQTVNGNPALNGLIANGFSNFIPAGVTPCTDPTQPGFSGGRASCLNRNVRNRVNASFSDYNGLQTEVRAAEWHGLSGAGSFSWSKTLDNASEIFSTFSGGTTVAGAQNPYDISAGEKSLSGLDFPKIASLYVIYELPFYKGQHGFLGRVLGGYQANATWRYSSGQNYTPALLAGFNTSCQTSYDNTFFGASTCRPFMGNSGAPVDTVGQCTDHTLADCGLIDYYTGAATTKSAVHWIYNTDEAALFFKTPYGNVRRNPGVRGQNISAVNFSMFKTTMINERVSFRLEAQVYNLFNHQFRGVPDPFVDDCSFADRQICGFGGTFGNNFSNPSGGDYTNTILNGIGRRRMILGAKLTF